jgi:hypothetical protein
LLKEMKSSQIVQLTNFAEELVHGLVFGRSPKDIGHIEHERLQEQERNEPLVVHEVDSIDAVCIVVVADSVPEQLISWLQLFLHQRLIEIHAVHPACENHSKAIFIFHWKTFDCLTEKEGSLAHYLASI